MAITIDGNSFTWTGTVTVTNATDLSTGVCTLMLTPAGGIGNMPVLAEGPPGMPAVFDSVTYTQVPWGTTPAAPVLTTVSSGGPGVSSHYTLALQGNSGPQGPPGTMTISSATDLTGTLNNKYTLAYNTSTSLWEVVPQRVGNTYQATNFTAATGNTSPQTLATITVPAQNFAWIPRVDGLAVPSGTANTHLDLQCLMTIGTSVSQVGFGKGITGAGSGSIPAYPVILIPAFGGAVSSGYGQVPAGSSATFAFNVIQTGATTNSFSVPTTDCYFQVKVDPIPQ